MIFKTSGDINAFSWNTNGEVELAKGTHLSDFTSLPVEFSSDVLNQTYNALTEREKIPAFSKPMLMTVASGEHMGCRVWIDGIHLLEEPNIYDPQGEPWDYSE